MSRTRHLTRTHKRRNILLWVGQSNATGNSGLATYSPTYPTVVNNALSLTPVDFCTTTGPGVIPGVRDNAAPTVPTTLLPFVPIVEGRDSFDSSTGESVVHGESGATACAMFLWNKTREKSIAINTGRDGAGYSTSPAQNQGSTAYNWSKIAVKAAREQYGLDAIVRAILCIHGEADAVSGAATTTITSDTSLPAGTLNCAAFTINANIVIGGFSGTTGHLVVRTSTGLQKLTYTGATSGQFTGVTGGTGTIAAGDTIYRADYYNYLNTWVANYQSDLAPLTGQELTRYPINLYFTQQCFYPTGGGSNTGKTALMGYAAWKDAVTTLGAKAALKLIGPQYYLPGSSIGNALHAGVGGQRWMGEQFAKFIWRNEFLGLDHRPLYPTGITRSTSTLTVTFNVPVGALTYDARMVKLTPNWGFEYTDSGGSITISSVTITGTNTIQIVLSADPSANTRKYLRYAWTAQTNHAGTMGNTRGNLRDSDSEVSSYGYPLYNWCVTFEEPVP